MENTKSLSSSSLFTSEAVQEVISGGSLSQINIENRNSGKDICHHHIEILEDESKEQKDMDESDFNEVLPSIYRIPNSLRNLNKTKTLPSPSLFNPEAAQQRRSGSSLSQINMKRNSGKDESDFNEVLPSIYRIPNSLRNLNKSAYTPRFISIGPLHRDEEELKPMEKHKETYMSKLIGRIADEQKRDQSKIKDECRDAVLKKITHARACYAEGIENYNDSEFANVMVLDACFILQLLSHTKKVFKRSDPIFCNALVLTDVMHDLTLLENQLPFFILQEIFSKILKEPCDLTNMVLSFFKKFQNPSSKPVLNQDTKETNHDHILGLLHKRYQHPNGHPKEACCQTNDPVGNEIEWMTIPLTRCMTELKQAGVELKPSTVNSFKLVVNFRAPSPLSSWLCLPGAKPMLEIPVLCIDDYTESFLRNMIAYEQCCPDVDQYITSYVLLMDRLVDSKEDINILVRSKVLINQLGSSEDASKVLNSLGEQVFFNKFLFKNQCEQLQTHCDSNWRFQLATLRRVYCGHPWTPITVIAAFILFALTIIQTIYAVIGTK